MTDQPKRGLGLDGTFREYFLEYASYVITDRAIPDLTDGLKPVQRRILHSLWENEDGRYNKVANIVGHTMKYHPHGDTSIYSALVSMGQKELLIDTQGNWGNPVTGDSAAAARYIEARLTPFAKRVVFQPELTEYQLSYDGRNREPVLLPVRFPLLLATGAEGIAVGLTTRVLPHNPRELLEAQKAWLKGEEFQLFPDFPGGGFADVSLYDDGRTGSRIKVRARIEPGPGKSLLITQIAYGTTTESVIDSILSAHDKGKIKVAKIDDNTAAETSISVVFQRGVDMEQAVDALYAFTQCEVSIATNSMVIHKGRPRALSTAELLVESARNTRSLLRRDLEIQQFKLEEKWHRKSLVQIFIENRIYLRIEKCTTWPAVLYEIDHGLEPHKDRLRRDVIEEDLVYLTEVRIRRISAWDAERARDELEAIDAELAKVRKNLRNLTAFTIQFIDQLISDFGEAWPRRTELTEFGSVKAAAVAAQTAKLYVDRKGGFIGTDPKIGEELGPCSTLDDILVIRATGELMVSRVASRKYVGEKILHVQIFREEDRDRVFNLVYQDTTSGRTYVKRFTTGGVTRDKPYPLGKGKKPGRLLHLSTADGRYAHVRLRKKPRVKQDIYVSFDDYLVKGRGAGGVTLTPHTPSSVKEISERIYKDRTGADRARDEESPGGGTGDQNKLF